MSIFFKKILVFNLALTLAINMVGASVFADEQQILVYNQKISQSHTLSGVYGSTSVFFNVSDNWNLQNGNFFDLYFKHSIGDKPRGSSITIELNKIPIESIFVDSMKEIENYKRIVLPKEHLKPGFNELKIKTYHRITDLICEDDMNPANWITISENSYIHMEYKDKLDMANIGSYPYPYVKEYKDNPIEFKFLVDNRKPSPDITKALAVIASNIGSKARFKDLKFSITTVEEMNMDQNYIYIGQALPEKFKNLVNVNLEEANGYIGRAKLENDKQLLFIVSKNIKNLPIIAQKLSSEFLKPELNAELITLLPEEIKLEDKMEVKNSFSLSDLGYDNIYMEGAKTSIAQFAIDIPQNWKLEEGSKIVLNTRYSKAVDFDNSSVAVLINGIPVGSQILKGEYAQDDVLTFSIPKELRDQKSLSVTVKVYLDGDFDCKDGTINPNFWFYISNKSNIYMPYINKTHYNLEDYPAPFASDFTLKDVNLVLDETFGLEDLELLLDVVSYMARSTTNPPILEVSIGKLNPNANNIVIGLIDTMLIKSINESLNMPYSYEKQEFKSKEKYILLESSNKSIATGQFMKPKDSKYATLVLTARDYGSYLNISPFFTNALWVSKLSGDTVFSDSSGYYQTFDLNPKPKNASMETQNVQESDEMQKNVRVSYENARNFIIFLTALIAVIIILIIVIRDKNKKHKI